LGPYFPLSTLWQCKEELRGLRDFQCFLHETEIATCIRGLLVERGTPNKASRCTIANSCYQVCQGHDGAKDSPPIFVKHGVAELPWCFMARPSSPDLTGFQTL
jgi:hypothetical protein